MYFLVEGQWTCSVIQWHVSFYSTSDSIIRCVCMCGIWEDRQGRFSALHQLAVSGQAGSHLSGLAGCHVGLLEAAVELSRVAGR